MRMATDNAICQHSSRCALCYTRVHLLIILFPLVTYPFTATPRWTVAGYAFRRHHTRLRGGSRLLFTVYGYNLPLTLVGLHTYTRICCAPFGCVTPTFKHTRLPHGYVCMQRCVGTHAGSTRTFHTFTVAVLCTGYVCIWVTLTVGSARCIALPLHTLLLYLVTKFGSWFLLLTCCSTFITPYRSFPLPFLTPQFIPRLNSLNSTLYVPTLIKAGGVGVAGNEQAAAAWWGRRQAWQADVVGGRKHDAGPSLANSKS